MTSIEATIERLTGIVDDSRQQRSRDGYFAALYRNVTVAMRDRIRSGRFDDADRMERFVVAFADRYLDAHRAWRAGEPTTASWALTFEAVGRWRPVALQHLLVGMNAHINLDLGVVAAELAGDSSGLPALRRDFDQVNRVLGELVEASQGAVASVSPWLSLVDRFGGRSDEAIIRFSLRVARDQAWRAAQRLAPLEGTARLQAIDALDQAVAGIGRRVLHPGARLTLVLLLVRLRETASVPEVIDALTGA